VVADAPSPPNRVHTQTPAGGALAAPGTTVQVAYDDTATAPLVRLKRKSTNVWILSSNPDHVQYLLGGGSGYEYINEATLGQAYHPSTPPSSFLVPFYSFFTDDGHLGTNRYYSTDLTPPPGWTRESGGAHNGVAGLVFNQQFPGTIPVYRLVKASGPDYTYATSPGDLSYYQSRGFVIDAPLGYVRPWSHACPGAGWGALAISSPCALLLAFPPWQKERKPGCPIPREIPARWSG
jgi:hypothetical protein